MQGFWSIECGPVQISGSQSYSGSKVLEPDHLDEDRMLARLCIEKKRRTNHEPPVIPSVMGQDLRRPTSWVITEEPHIRSVGIEFGLDMRGEVVASIDNHPNIRRF